MFIFFFFLQESFNSLYFSRFSTFFQKDVKIETRERYTIIEKQGLPNKKLTFIGTIFLSIFVLFLIRIGFILKEKENKFNGFLFIFPKIFSSTVSFSIAYVSKDQQDLRALKYNIYFSDPNIKIRKITIWVMEDPNSYRVLEQRTRTQKTSIQNILLDLKIIIGNRNDIFYRNM